MDAVRIYEVGVPFNLRTPITYDNRPYENVPTSGKEIF